MSEEEKILIIGAIDDLLVEELGCREQLTEKERQIILNRCFEIFDTTSPRDVRERLTELARSLYEEVFE